MLVEFSSAQDALQCAIAIQIDSLASTYVKKEGELLLFNDSIQKILAKHCLAFRLKPRPYDTLLVYRNKKLVKAYPQYFTRGSRYGVRNYVPTIKFKGKQTYSSRGRRNNASYDMYYLFGPVDSGDLIEMRYKNQYGHEFQFKNKPSDTSYKANYPTYTLTRYNKTIHPRPRQTHIRSPQSTTSNYSHWRLQCHSQ